MVKEALILSGGLGTRLYPLGKYLPKCLIPVYDSPLIIHHINMLEGLGIERAYIVVSNKFRSMIEDSIALGYEGNVEINYIIQEKSTGCGQATLLGKEVLKDQFFIILGDEYYESDYFFRTALEDHKYDHYLGVTNFDSISQIVSNCQIISEDDQIVKLIEKPKVEQIVCNSCWNGAGLTNRKIFDVLENMKREGQIDPKRGVVLIEAFNQLVKQGVGVGSIVDPNININVTTVEDYLRASEVERLKKSNLQKKEVLYL